MSRRIQNFQDMRDDSCRYCHGTGCTSCNGTGIDGNPALGFLVLLITAALTLSLIIWAVS